MIIGISILLIFAPLDLFWHETFGFDGFLSPTHVMLTTGIITFMLGSAIGLIKMTREFPTRKNFIKSFLAVTFASFWLTIFIYVYTFVTPFSKGEILDFTPDPYIAVTISIIGIPFISSMVFWSISKTYNYFGAVSIVTLLILLIISITSIITVDGLEIYLS